jgi:uracil-DNA glycosylase family 4
MLSKEDIEKIANFLQQYRVLYGDTILVDQERIDDLMKEIPEIELASREKPMPTDVVKLKKEQKEKPDSELWNFMREIKDCTKCPLGKTRTTFVFGDGNENADILFIGEAPGAEEDRTGIPFVGRAGQLLNKLLTNIKIKREDVFIANILKCRPPGNRDPQPDEVEKCIPYLQKQIQMIQPKIIVALGRIAAQNLLNTTNSLKQMRSRLWQYQGVDMIVTYHTAAILRNAGLLNSSIEDFKYISQIYHEKLKQQR